VRWPSSAHTCGLVPPGSLAGVRACRPEPGPWSSAADGCCVTARPARRVRAGPPGLVTSAVTGSSWPGQLPGARPWRHPGRGLGHAGSRRRQHEEIVDGDAGRTAPVLHLSRSTASKLTILLQPCLSAPRQRRPTQARPASADRPGLRYTPHLGAAASPRSRVRSVKRPVRPSSTTNLPHGGQGLPLLQPVLTSSAIGQLERSVAHRGESVCPRSWECVRRVWTSPSVIGVCAIALWPASAPARRK
jgi:hypothetical protein